jgi:RHO1 GDP-GTP exchange protein 1/2
MLSSGLKPANPKGCIKQMKTNSYFATMVNCLLRFGVVLMPFAELGIYVDRHGDASRPQNEVVVEWEGTAERVAFHPPYLLLFDSRFIEVRHIETGRLVQKLPGSEVRCTWNARGISTVPPIHTPGPDGSQESSYQEPRVQGVMNAQEPSTGVHRPLSIVQQVFELVPTIPFFVPKPLQSTTT